MSNPQIVIIDTGISQMSRAFSRVIESYEVVKSDKEIYVLSCESTDYIGHGSAVSDIICDINPNVDIISFRICNDNIDIDEEILLSTLEYIEEKINADFINISAGLTYSYHYHKMNDLCRKISEKHTVIVSAFENDGAVSYPAMFEDVIGVDVTRSFASKHDIIMSKNGIVDVFVPDIFYRTVFDGRKTIIKGTSFASAKITGLLSCKFNQKGNLLEKSDWIDSISTETREVSKSISVLGPQFPIRKAILFPVNKELQALLRYKDLLTFQIAGVYDEKMLGNVGKEVFGEVVQSYDRINWNDDFDTIILSCSVQLSSVTKHLYMPEIVKLASKYNKNVYSFEYIDRKYTHCFYPDLQPEMIPYKNHYKLHQTTIPVVGVWGTSSKQGKFSLQLELIRRFRKSGYNTGHISTEPSGYLFGADFVFHYGYNAHLNIEPWESTILLNHMVWETQTKNKDILITGGQSGTIPYSNMTAEKFFTYQYNFLAGTRPDFNILCVNPHDEKEYVAKTIGFINSMTENGVQALVVYPIEVQETSSGISYGLKNLSFEEQKMIKRAFTNYYSLPVYLLSAENDLNDLYNLVVDFFAEDVEDVEDVEDERLTDALKFEIT